MKINDLKHGKKKIFDIKNFTINEILNESLLDAKEKNAKNMSDEEFAFVVSFDPLLHDQVNNLTPENMANMNESYVKWLIKMFKKGELDSNHREKIINILKMFDYNKKRRNVLPNNDIFAYKSFEDIESALSSIGDNLTVNQKNKDAKRNQQKLSGEKQPGVYLDGNVELLFNGNEWEIWKPLTFEGSKALRRGASWCTGGDDPAFYNRYTEQGTLYVIMRKDNNADKYQLFVSNPNSYQPREFRDADNEELSFRRLCHENPEMLDFFLTQSDVVDAYPNLDDPDADDDEWNENMENTIMDEYHLTYVYGDLCVEISGNDLYKHGECKYTTSDQYEEIFRNGELYQTYWESIGLKSYIVLSQKFLTLNWEETKLKTLYDMYKKETNEEETFQEFLQALFNTKLIGQEKYLSVYHWLCDRKYYSTSTIIDLISKECIIDTLEDDIMNNLERLGTGFGDYKWTDVPIYYPLEQHDIQSVRDFYENYVETGEIRSYEDIFKCFNIHVKENIDPENAKLGNYEYYHMKKDAEKIFNFFNPEEQKEEYYESDNELDEVFKIAGVQLNEGIADLQKYFPKMDLETIKKLVALDPTYKGGDQLGKYGRWILQLAYNNVKNKIAFNQYKELLNQYPDGINPKNGQEFQAPTTLPAIKDEDLYKITPALKKYDLYKKEIGKPIDSFKTLPELNTVINNIENSDIPKEKHALKRYQLFKIAKEKGLKVAFEDSMWIVGIPTTKESSCVFADDTHWCTTQRSHGYYEEYTKDGDLYINLNKNTGALYQFHFESDSFMDENDQSIDFMKVIDSDEGLKDFYLDIFDKNIDKMMSNPDRLNDEAWLENGKINGDYIEGEFNLIDLERIYKRYSRSGISISALKEILGYDGEMYFSSSELDNQMIEYAPNDYWEENIKPLDIPFVAIQELIVSYGESYNEDIFSEKQAEEIYKFLMDHNFDGYNIIEIINQCMMNGSCEQARYDIIDQLSKYLPLDKEQPLNYDDTLNMKIPVKNFKDVMLIKTLQGAEFWDIWLEKYHQVDEIDVVAPYDGWYEFDPGFWEEMLPQITYGIKEIMDNKEYTSSNDDIDDEDDEYYDDLEEVFKIAGVKL